MTDTAITVFRDYVTDGVPSSGSNKPKKAAIRTLLTGYETIINTFTSNGGLIYSSLSLLNGDLSKAANAMAWVLGDPVSENNGLYGKVGASGAGSWTRRGDLPFSFIVASNVGAGTPNAIQATTSIPVSGSALVWLNIVAANTGPVTVSFNGGAPLTVKSNTGNDIAAGGLVGDMIILGIVSSGTFRIVSDQASSAIVAAAEAAQAAAEAAQAAAEAAAGSVQNPVSRVDANLQTMAGPLAAPYVLPAYRGLKISEFLTSTSPSSMQQPAAAAMIAALFSSSRYVSADGEGIVIPTTTPIDVAAVAGMTGVAPGAKGVMLHNIGFTTQAGFPTKTLISRNFAKTVGSAVVTGNTVGLEPGMWVYGQGVGEGVFILSVDIVASSGGQITLSQKCYNGSTHTMNFEKLNYILDFAGFGQGNRVNRLQLKNIQFTFSNGGNGVRLPMNHYSCSIDSCIARGTPERVVFDGAWNPDGSGAGFKFTHNDISVGEVMTEPASRQSYGLVLNASDAHIESNDVSYTKTAFVLGGGGYTFVANHPWQGTSSGARTTTTPSVIFTAGAPRTIFSDNYIDNSFLEFTDTSIPNDRDWLGSVSGSGNRFTNVETGTTFSFITMRPQRQNRTLRHFRLGDCLFTEKSGSGTVSVSGVQSQLGFTINVTGQDNLLTGSYEDITPQMEPMTVVATDGAAKTTRTVPLASFPFGMGPSRVLSAVMQSVSLVDFRFPNNITPSAKSVDIVSASVTATWVVTATSNAQQITATV